MNHFYQEIQGHFNFEGFYSSMVNSAPRNAKFVEVGVWRGKSFAYLLVECLNSGKDISLFAVDPWDLNQFDEALRQTAESMSESVYDEFISTMTSHEVIDKFTVMQMTSEQASLQFENDSLDFVYIDADHDYESVKNDINLWLPKVKIGGVIAGHDYHNHPPVREAVHEIFGSNISQRAKDRTWIYRKLSAQIKKEGPTQ